MGTSPALFVYFFTAEFFYRWERYVEGEGLMRLVRGWD